jgi:hypothetical protein
MTYVYLILVGIAAGWLGQKIIAGKQRTKADQKYSDREYDNAISAVRDADWELALSHLGLSIGRCPSLTAYRTLGIVWGALKRWDLAADSFYRGICLARGPNFSHYPGYPEERVCEFYARESLSHARSSNWEFAYLRSREALDLIREGLLPRDVESGDCESWLRLIRMVAAVQFLEENEALSSAQEDAKWILANSRVSGYDRLANIVLCNLADFSTLRSLLLQEWQDHDESIRDRVPIIFDPLVN